MNTEMNGNLDPLIGERVHAVFYKGTTNTRLADVYGILSENAPMLYCIQTSDNSWLWFTTDECTAVSVGVWDARITVQW